MRLDQQAFRDAQFVTVFVTVPFGAVLGSTASVVLRELRESSELRAGRMAAACGTTTILALASMIVWWSADSRGGGLAQLVGTLLSPVDSAFMVCSGGVTIWGILRMMFHR